MQYEQLASQFREIQDDSRENHLLLTEKNRVLLEKQDYDGKDAIRVSCKLNVRLQLYAVHVENSSNIYTR